jgi:hypothetical protein
VGAYSGGDETMKSFKDLPEFNELDLQNPTGFLLKINKWIYYFNYLSKYLSFTKNFSGSIIELQFAAGESKIISHLLGVQPKYRIILRQEGNGVLSDIPSSWTDKVAGIVNNGAVTVNATIMFMKE